MVRWWYRNHIVSWWFQHHFWDGWLFNWFLSWPGRPKSRKARLAPAVEMVHRVHWPRKVMVIFHTLNNQRAPEGRIFIWTRNAILPGRLLSFLAATMLGMWQGRLGMISSQSNRHVRWNPAIVWLSWPFDDSQDSGYLHLVLPRTSAKKSATPPSLLLRGERERERVTSHFSWGYAAQHFCPALSRVSNVCGWWTSQFFLRSSLGWYLGALLPKALSTSTSFRCGSQKPAREVGQNSLPNRWNPLGCGWAQHFATVTQFQDLPLAFANLIWRWSTRHG